MRRTCRLAIAFALAALAGCSVGCAGASHDATLSAGARRAQQNVLAICASADPAAVRATGGVSAAEKDVEILVAEAKRRHDAAIARRAMAAFRSGKRTTACGPGYADRIELELLPRVSPQTVQNAGVSGGLEGFRRGAIGYYTTHFGAGEDVPEYECVTTSAGLYEDVPELESFLYLLSVGNAQARQVLAHLRADCRAEGR
jgi:hypothetical protein